MILSKSISKCSCLLLFIPFVVMAQPPDSVSVKNIMLKIILIITFLIYTMVYSYAQNTGVIDYSKSSNAKKENWLDPPLYRYNIFVGLTQLAFSMGTRYQFNKNISAELSFAVDNNSDYGGVLDQLQYYNLDINVHFTKIPIVFSIIYLYRYRNTPKLYEDVSYIFPTIGIMTRNRINFHARVGIGGQFGGINDSGGIAEYADIGIGYNFNLLKQQQKQ